MNEQDIVDTALKMSANLRLMAKNAGVQTPSQMVTYLLNPEVLAVALFEAANASKPQPLPKFKDVHEDTPYEEKFTSELIRLPDGEYPAEMSGHNITIGPTGQEVYSSVGIRCLRCKIIVVVKNSQVVDWCQGKEGSCQDH